MKRVQVPTRPGWRDSLNKIGFDYWNLPSSDGSHYWSEGVAYEFSLKQIDRIEDATNELHAMCMEFVDRVVTRGMYPPIYGFSEYTKQLIQDSWKRRDPHVFGRFDLAYDGTKLKMLEYNADTPTSLLEASVAQWEWVTEASVPNHDQFNSLHERLIKRWEFLKKDHSISNLHLVGSREAGREDWGNIEYLAETVAAAGISVHQMPIDDLGVLNGQIWDSQNRPVDACFKLYPWEWMINEEYASTLKTAKTRWIEPAWKMLLSNKALLRFLWNSHVGHPLLLETQLETPYTGDWIRKPTLSREGANVQRLTNGITSKLSGSDFHSEYDKNGYIYQRWIDLPNFDGFYPILGSWVIGDQASGLGIREDFNLVTGNDSHFVPHYFVE